MVFIKKRLKILKTKSNLFQKLTSFKNDEISISELNEHNDELINEIYPTGLVEIVFEEELDYVKLFRYEDYDKMLISCLFSNYYYKPDLIEDYHVNEEWNYGTLFYNFNNENITKLNNILSFFGMSLDLDNDKIRNEIAIFLKENFSRDVDDIIIEYSNQLETAYSTYIETEVKSEICNIFNIYSIWEQSCLRTYYTTIDDLITLYDEHSNGNEDLSLYSILENIAEDISVTGDFNQQIYSLNIDNEEFNRVVSNSLDDILEKTENEIDFSDIEEYKKILTKLKKYNFNRYYNLPKNNNIQFLINKVDPETNLIHINLYDTATFNKIDGTISFDNLNLLLYHPELFTIFD